MYNAVNHFNSHLRHKDYEKKMRKNISTGYIRCEVIEDFADTINSIENVFTYKIDNVLTGDAIANIVIKVNSIINDIIAKMIKWLKPFAFIRNAISKEDAVVSIIRILGVSIQRFQSSLEDALSFTSLLMELLSTLSLILVLVLLT